MSSELLPIASSGTTARLLLRLVGEHRAAATGPLVAFVIASLASLVPPWVLGGIVDDVRAGAEPDRIVRGAILIGVAALVGGLFTWLAVALLARCAEPALATLREEVLDRALHLDAGRLESAGAGDLLSRVGDDVRTVTESLDEVVPLVVSSALAVALTAAGLFALDWRLGLAGLVAAPVYVIALRWYLPISAPLYRDERVAQGERAQALVDGIGSAATVRAFGTERSQLAAVEQGSDRAKGIAITVFASLTRYFTRNNMAEAVGLLSILTVGFFGVRSSALTVGAVTAAALYFHRLFNPIGALLTLFDEVQSTGASLTRLAGVATMPRPLDSGAFPTRQGPVAVTGIEHAYVAGRPVLHSTNLAIAPGERVAVVGETGAGKTTLGAIVAGVLRPSTGHVSVAGVDVSELSPRELRRHIMLVSQDAYVFAGTVRESLVLARPEATDDDLWTALEATGAAAWVRALPQGLDTAVGEHGHQLTAAQGQHLALTRVALADPWLVVLDEATAEAGSAGARDLEEAALAVTQGRSALVIAHRLTQAQTADRILVMAHGRVVESGHHRELVASGGRYADLWRAWSASS